MDKNSIPPKFNLQLLQEYIQASHLITGKYPKELSVSQDLFNWYRDQRSQVAKNFNLNHTNNKDTDMSFMGVKLIAKLELV